MRGQVDSMDGALGSPYVQPLAWRNGHWGLMVASCLARYGDSEMALDWLERAIDLGFSNHRYLGEVSPLLAPLHGNPRFKALLKIARLKEGAVEA
jgi:hypothetical protein